MQNWGKWHFLKDNFWHVGLGMTDSQSVRIQSFPLKERIVSVHCRYEGCTRLYNAHLRNMKVKGDVILSSLNSRKDLLRRGGMGVSSNNITNCMNIFMGTTHCNWCWSGKL